MKHILLALLLFLFLFPQAIYAHGVGQPPILKINGTYASYYPPTVYTSSITKISLPQDFGLEKYFVNTPIQFEIDFARLGIPDAIAKTATFTWDFGEGPKVQGLQAAHTYKISGTHIVTIMVNYNQPDYPSDLVFNTVLLNIVPTKEYKLPKPVILVNSHPSNANNDALILNIASQLTLAASKSTAGSSKIVSYEWDLGNGEKNTGKSVRVRYKPEYEGFQVTPLLRVTDEQGFYTDTFVTLYHDPTKLTENKLPRNIFFLFVALLVITLGVFVSLFVFTIKQKK